MRRRAAEVERVNRWRHNGGKSQASLDKFMGLIKSIDSEIYELGCERNGRFIEEFVPRSIDRPSLSGHDPPHQPESPCSAAGCYLLAGHPPPHKNKLLETSRTLAVKSEEIRKEAMQRNQAFDRLVLSDMRNSQWPAKQEHHDQKSAARVTQATIAASNPTPKQHVLDSSTTATRSKLPYLELDFSSQQIRLFELYPKTEATDIQGSFLCVELTACPAYTALSYTWGDATDPRQITVGGSGTIDVRKNLWEFLFQQSSAISEPKLFWIDAICINQSNVHERNHQVNLMKQIYVKACEDYIWLGGEADNSGLAIDYITMKGSRKLRPRGPGFRAVWTREEGKALCHLCERPYWRRMWIIQEIVHAEKITVWCGAKSFEWGILENLYLTLKTLEDMHWFAHHEFAIGVLQSSAAVMVWQRAHWRHPQTPTPSLQTLIEVFRDWQCTDVRDKVFALVSMASSDTAIIPDYSQPARQVYFAVQAGPRFNEMLSQVLGLSRRDLELSGQDLIEYKQHPPEGLVLRKRVEYKSRGLESP